MKRQFVKNLGSNWAVYVSAALLSQEQLEEMRNLTDSYESLFSKRARKYKELDLKNKNLSDYLDYLNHNSGELDHLIDAFTINVSRFFRNSLVFEYISKIVISIYCIKIIIRPKRFYIINSHI